MKKAFLSILFILSIAMGGIIVHAQETPEEKLRAWAMEEADVNRAYAEEREAMERVQVPAEQTRTNVLMVTMVYLGMVAMTGFGIRFFFVSIDED